MRNIMKNSILRIIIIIFILIVMSFMYKLFYESKFQKSIKLKDDSNFIEEKSSILNLEVGNYYKVNYELYANNESTINGADTPEFVINTNTFVLLIQLDGKFAKVKYNNNFGWIPAWYLSDEAQNVNFLPPFLLITKGQSNLYLYPQGDNAYDKSYNIQEGRTVKIMAEFNNWYLINFLRYDNPEFDPLWINKDKTTTYDVNIVKEGYLKENTVFYSKNGIKTDESIEGYVIITSEENGLYKVKGTGGQNGYIKKSDFIPFDLETYSKFLLPLR